MNYIDIRSYTKTVFFVLGIYLLVYKDVSRYTITKNDAVLLCLRKRSSFFFCGLIHNSTYRICTGGVFEVHQSKVILSGDMGACYDIYSVYVPFLICLVFSIIFPLSLWYMCDWRY